MPYVTCAICEQDFYVKPSHQKLGWGKYCSTECRTKAQLKGQNIECLICGKSTYKSLAQIKHSKSGNFFCSKSCQTRWRNSHFLEQNHPNWVNGNKTYRKILLRSGVQHECVSCKNSDLRVLVAHHIDHNRQNNSVSNLALVCLNCHHLIHHDKNFEAEFKTHLKNNMVAVA